MGTRSYICYETKKGEYIGIYCHADGYLTYNGAMLLDHYCRRDRVKALMALGNLSSLGERLYPDRYEEHDFEHRQDGVCVFYGRDRGEKEQQATEVKLTDIDDPTSWIEYCYVYGLDGVWRYFECGHLDEGLKDLSEGLDEEYRKLGFPRPEGYYGFYTQDDIKRLRCLYKHGKEEEREVRIAL